MEDRFYQWMGGGVDYVGVVDDIRIFDKTLAADEIVQIVEEHRAEAN